MKEDPLRSFGLDDQYTHSNNEEAGEDENSNSNRRNNLDLAERAVIKSVSNRVPIDTLIERYKSTAGLTTCLSSIFVDAMVTFTTRSSYTRSVLIAGIGDVLPMSKWCFARSLVFSWLGEIIGYTLIRCINELTGTPRYYLSGVTQGIILSSTATPCTLRSLYIVASTDTPWRVIWGSRKLLSATCAWCIARTSVAGLIMMQAPIPTNDKQGKRGLVRQFLPTLGTMLASDAIARLISFPLEYNMLFCFSETCGNTVSSTFTDGLQNVGKEIFLRSTSLALTAVALQGITLWFDNLHTKWNDSFFQL
eukprot:m.305048 g.305048  ORF g.305048 m.305048 type:complete len:307 (-) comp16446_c4_seq11:3-923(-)